MAVEQEEEVNAQIERKLGEGRRGRETYVKNKEDEMPRKEIKKWRKRRLR
jgi:hypothetical protein